MSELLVEFAAWSVPAFGPLAFVLPLTAVWTLVIVMVLDLGAARVGAIRTSSDVHSRTMEGFAGEVRVPGLRWAGKPRLLTHV